MFVTRHNRYLRNQTLGEKVDLETICVAIFVPPKYHLLLRYFKLFTFQKIIYVKQINFAVESRL